MYGCYTSDLMYVCYTPHLMYGCYTTDLVYGCYISDRTYTCISNRHFALDAYTILAQTRIPVVLYLRFWQGNSWYMNLA